jgi:hypothetical protein
MKRKEFFFDWPHSTFAAESKWYEKRAAKVSEIKPPHAAGDFCSFLAN